MKRFLIIVLLAFITSKKKKPDKTFDYETQYSSILKKIFVEKAYQVKTKDSDYADKINSLHIPEHVKNRIKTVNTTTMYSKDEYITDYSKFEQWCQEHGYADVKDLQYTYPYKSHPSIT